MEPFIGQIMAFGGNFAPRGWALCDGQLLPISQNQALFAILGTTYGGDGKTTFALPDLRGRLPMHWGTGPGLTPRRIGDKGGAESVTLTVNNMPAHNHTLNASSSPAAVRSPEGASLAAADTYLNGKVDATLSPTTVGNTGGSLPVNTESPFLCITWIIALTGMFPSRD